MILFLKIVFSNLIVRFICKKLENFYFWNIRKYMEYFLKKTFSSFQKLFVTQLVGGKNAGDSRPSSSEITLTHFIRNSKRNIFLFGIFLSGLKKQKGVFHFLITRFAQLLDLYFIWIFFHDPWDLTAWSHTRFCYEILVKERMEISMGNFLQCHQQSKHRFNKFPRDPGRTKNGCSIIFLFIQGHQN